jgi:hypothetical protein
MTIMACLVDAQIDVLTLLMESRDLPPVYAFFDLLLKEEFLISDTKTHGTAPLSGRRLARSQHPAEDQLLSQTHHPSIKRSHQKRTTIQICSCNSSDLAVQLSSVSSDDLAHTSEIHVCNIQRDEVHTKVPSSCSNRTVADLIVDLLEKTKPRRLILRDCNLHISGLFDIMEVLRRKHANTLECLDLRYNGFKPRVLQWILAMHLPSFQSLREVYLRQGIQCMVHQNVRDALLDVLENNQNHVLEKIDLFDWDRSIEHMLDVNRAGRRVLQCKAFPIGLWPLLLERAANGETLAKRQSSQPLKRRLAARQVNALYFIVRNVPFLFSKSRAADKL